LQGQHKLRTHDELKVAGFRLGVAIDGVRKNRPPHQGPILPLRRRVVNEGAKIETQRSVLQAWSR